MKNPFAGKKERLDAKTTKRESFGARCKRRFCWTVDRLLEGIVFAAAFRFIGPVAALTGFAVYFLLLGKRSVQTRIGFGLGAAVLVLALQIAYAEWH